MLNCLGGGRVAVSGTLSVLAEKTVSSYRVHIDGRADGETYSGNLKSTNLGPWLDSLINSSLSDAACSIICVWMSFRLAHFSAYPV